jgi:hypothetical protein
MEQSSSREASSLGENQEFLRYVKTQIVQYNAVSIRGACFCVNNLTHLIDIISILSKTSGS